MRHHDAHDDVTVLAMSATGDARSRSANLDLPGDATAPRQARRFVRATLESWSIDGDTVSTAELCVSELVTNAVIHAGTPPALAIRSDGDLLTVVVQDHGAHGTAQRVEDYDPMTVSGRGLTLVDALTVAWSAERSSDGTSVWFELELNHAAAGTG
jgi:anti-sigma regulatory factor (Ser/Thr protein kinase)